MRDFIQALPKTETHLHAEGALPYELLTAWDPEQWPPDPLFRARRYRYSSFPDFERILLDHALPWFTTAERYHEAAKAIFAKHVAQNVRYVETSFHLPVTEFIQVPGPEIIAAIRAAVPEGLEVRVFAGTEAGLFVSDDAGARWRAAGVPEPIRSIRQSPADPQRWVVGLQDRGVAVSTDGARTWRYGEGIVADHTIYEAEFHPADPAVLYAGGWQTGVLRSADLGRTWTRLDDGMEETNVHSLLVSRRRPGLLMAGTLGGGCVEAEVKRRARPEEEEHPKRSESERMVERNEIVREARRVGRASTVAAWVI